MIILFFLLSIIEVQRPRIVHIETPDQKYDKIPLTDFKVDVEVSGTAAQANYTLKYENIDNITLVEGKLKFPFDVDVAVSDVLLEYKNKTIVGQIMKKSDAKIVYDNEKRDKNVAMLVQRVDDFISIDLAGIEPNETFIAKISTYAVLDLKFEHKKENFFTRYTFPTSMVPRYLPLQSDKNYENPLLSTNVSYSFEFNLKTSSGKISEDSVSNLKVKSKGKIEWNDTTFSYSGDVPDDVVIDIITSAPNSHVEMTIEHFENSTVTEISLPGEVLSDLRKNDYRDEKTDVKESYVFLIDRSGSMYGEPIQKAKSALELFLHSMPSNSLFEIVGFGSRYSPLFNRLVEYNDSTLEEATKYVHSIDADMGGTEMLEPLKYILQQQPDHLIFLTDGAVFNVESVKSFCSRFSTQISTIAIGNYASKDLLKTISAQSSGTYEDVYDMNQIEGAVIRSLSAMKNGFLITSIKSNCGVIYQTFPVLLLQETVVPIRFFNENGNLKEKVVVELQIKDFLTKKNHTFTIDQQHAIVNEIEGKKLHCITLLKAINENVINDNEAFNQSLKLGLMTKQTSFILVDKRSLSEKEKYRLESVEIPVKMQNDIFVTSPLQFTRRASFASLNSKLQSTPERAAYKQHKSFNFHKVQTMNIQDEELLMSDIENDVVENGNNNNINDKCSRISSLQKADGKWILSDVLIALNIKLNKSDEMEWLKNKKENCEALLAGLFAIEHLNKNCGDLYKLVVEKGNSFINSNFSKQMIESALKIVKKY